MYVSSNERIFYFGTIGTFTCACDYSFSSEKFFETGWGIGLKEDIDCDMGGCRFLGMGTEFIELSIKKGLESMGGIIKFWGVE